MRGKVPVLRESNEVDGITPAYAGKSAALLVQQGNEEGSPPPMRGKELLLKIDLQRRRITPAYAGKSGIITVEVSYMQDHPRLCGEK